MLQLTVVKCHKLGTGREPGKCSSSAVGVVPCNGAWMNWDASWSSLCQMDPLSPMNLLKAGPPPWRSCFCLSSKNHWNNGLSCWIGIHWIGWIGLCVILRGPWHLGFTWWLSRWTCEGLSRRCTHTCIEKKKSGLGGSKSKLQLLGFFVYPILKAWLECNLLLLMHLLRPSKMFLLI